MSGGVTLDWPPEYRQWAEAEHASDRVIPAPHAASSMPVAVSARRPAPLRVVSPPDGATFLIDPTLRREFQTVSLRVTGAEREPIEWRVDEAVVGTSVDGAAIDWPLATGRHVVSARTQRGGTARAAIFVK